MSVNVTIPEHEIQDIFIPIIIIIFKKNILNNDFYKLHKAVYFSSLQLYLSKLFNKINL